jgi:hypothetical protein
MRSWDPLCVDSSLRHLADLDQTLHDAPVCSCFLDRRRVRPQHGRTMSVSASSTELRRPRAVQARPSQFSSTCDRTTATSLVFLIPVCHRSPESCRRRARRLRRPCASSGSSPALPQLRERTSPSPLHPAPSSASFPSTPTPQVSHHISLCFSPTRTKPMRYRVAADAESCSLGCPILIRRPHASPAACMAAGRSAPPRAFERCRLPPGHRAAGLDLARPSYPGPFPFPPIS